MRAIFSFFFVHSLFRKIKLHGSGEPQVAAWSSGWHATLLVVLLIVSNALDRAAARNLGSPVTDILALLILAPLLYPFLHAQKMINISCNDPAGATNSQFTPANFAWIAFGSIVWCLVLLGMTMP